MIKTATSWVLGLGVQDVIVFVLGGLFGPRLYGRVKVMYSRLEDAAKHLAGYQEPPKK